MPKRLAEIVVDNGLASRDEVIRAAREADRDKVPLVVTLVRRIGVDELALVADIKRHWRVPIADPATTEQDPEAVRELARDTCWRLRLIPLSISYPSSDRKVLHVAMADPTDTVAIAEVEHVTGGQVEPMLMPLSAVEELVESAYRAFVTEVMPRHRKKPRKAPGKAARSRPRQPAKNAAGAPAAKATENKLPFGAHLEVTTEPHARPATKPTAPRPPLSVPGAVPDAVDDEEQTSKGPAPNKPTTAPFHRVSDEADLELQMQALLELLVGKGVLTRDEFSERVRALMKRRDER